MRMMSEFLPRAHPKRLGQLDESNWKNLKSVHNIKRVDPAIRDVVLMLNRKGYRTFSSCSGGHRSNVRRRIDRHESGYFAFSPPSRIAFLLYTRLREMNEDFAFEAQAVIDDGYGGGVRRETVCTRLYWQLLDEKPARLEYYNDLFTSMQEIIEAAPGGVNDYKDVLSGVMGKEHVATGFRIVRSQMRRFSSR